MSENSNTLLKEWTAGGLANAITSAIVNPLDVTKTRMQAMTPSSIHGTSMIRIMKDLYGSNGLLGLWAPGLRASMARELLYSGPRTGFYVPVRDFLDSVIHEEENAENRSENNKRHEISLFKKITAAMITGTIGSLIANPVDLVKVRLMNEPKLYPSIPAALKSVYHEGGFLALYRGLLPSTLRAAFIAAGELATYDHCKSLVRRYSEQDDSIALHVLCSVVTGLVATTVAAPFDTIKTRTMNSVGLSPFKILRNTVAAEGFRSLFRGWLPSYFRLGPHAIICFPIFEQLRLLLGLGYL